MIGVISRWERVLLPSTQPDLYQAVGHHTSRFFHSPAYRFLF